MGKGLGYGVERNRRMVGCRSRDIETRKKVFVLILLSHCETLPGNSFSRAYGTLSSVDIVCTEVCDFTVGPGKIQAVF